MALSNWDTIAFDENGQSCTGIFMNKQKECIEIYKNWVHIHSPRMWRDKGSFVKPIIALLRSGSLDICHFEIELKRGPQNGVFVFASEGVRRGNTYHTRYFGGIGCSGYVDKVEEILKSLNRGTEEDDFWVSGSESGPDVKGIHYIENYKTREKIVYWDEDKQGKYDYGADWVGVKKETLNEFFKWLEELAENEGDDSTKKWIKLCKKSKKLRYNQGNAFFAKNLGVNLEATKVGKAKEPIANKIIANMNPKSKSK